MTSTELVPEDSRRLREITRRIAELRGTAARVLYELGAQLVEVEARSLWRAGEHEGCGIDSTRAAAALWRGRTLGRCA